MLLSAALLATGLFAGLANVDGIEIDVRSQEARDIIAPYVRKHRNNRNHYNVDANLTSVIKEVFYSIPLPIKRGTPPKEYALYTINVTLEHQICEERRGRPCFEVYYCSYIVTTGKGDYKGEECPMTQASDHWVDIKK